MSKVIVYHIWGKTVGGKQIQLDTVQVPEIGKPIKVNGVSCKVVDYARYQIEDNGGPKC